MSAKKLTTAVLGLPEDCGPLLEAVNASDYFEIAAVADRDTQVSEQKGREYNCEAYDDYRQLVIQNEFDCLFVTVGLHECFRYVKEGIKKGFNVLKLAPLGRDFEEAAELVFLADEKKVKLGVADTGRFSESYLLLREFLQGHGAEDIYLLKGTCVTAGRSLKAWRSDPKLSGGGVLLYEAYSLIDVILSNFHTPEQVYCILTNVAPDKRQRHYLPEDTAIVTLKFSENMIGNILVSRSSGGEGGQEKLKIYGKERVFSMSGSEYLQTDSVGKVERHFLREEEGDEMMKVLEDFGLSILSPEEKSLRSSGFVHLKTMAVIQSAYLSSRTGMPEEPRRILQMKGPASADIFTDREV